MSSKQITEKEDHLKKIFEKQKETLEKYEFYMVGTGLFTEFEKAKAIIAESKKQIEIEDSKSKSANLKHDKIKDFDSQLLDVLTEGLPE